MTAMMLCRRLFGSILLLTFSGVVWSQSLVTLTVLDSAGQPLPNATVTVADKWLQAGQQQQPQSVIIDQVDRQFTPFMTSIKVGSEVVFPNSDNIRHHVYSFSQPKPFELRLYSDDERPSVAFSRAGLVTLGCNIHDQMIAHIVITDNASAWVTDKQGQVSLPIAQAQSPIEISVWHPWLGNDLSKAKGFSLATQAPSPVTLPVSAPEPVEKKKSRLEQRFGRGNSL